MVGTVAEAEAGYTLADFSGDLVLDMAQNHQTVEGFNLGPAALQGNSGVAAQQREPAEVTDLTSDLVVHWTMDSSTRNGLGNYLNQATVYSFCTAYDDNGPESISSGKIGQAVSLNGSAYLSKYNGGAYCNRLRQHHGLQHFAVGQDGRSIQCIRRRTARQQGHFW